MLFFDFTNTHGGCRSFGFVTLDRLCKSNNWLLTLCVCSLNDRNYVWCVCVYVFFFLFVSSRHRKKSTEETRMGPRDDFDFMANYMILIKAHAYTIL